MPDRDLNTVIQHLRSAMLEHDGAGMTDGQLLDCFLNRREQAALEALVRRLAPMVWGVCRRLLHDLHDAEDAFQATFLVLLRRATCISPSEMVGNWLYGVAHQTALKARATAAKRRAREKQPIDMPEPVAPQSDSWPDLQPLLDQELSRLPDPYRVVIVLCELEGKSRKEAARQLGWPEGTVAGRLSRARELLAKRLTRRGVAVSGSLLAMLLARNSATAAVPIPVMSSTINAVMSVAAGQASAGLISTQVAALTAGATKAMLLSKIKFAAAVILTASFVCGAGVFMRHALADKPAAQISKEKPAAPSKEDATELTGTVQSVDAAKNTLTFFDKQFGVRTFDVARDARVILDDGSGSKFGFKDGKLADIAEGFVVTLRLAEDGKKVVGIWAEAATIHGELKAVSAEKRTVTVAIPGGKNEPAQEKTFEVAAKALVSVNDGKWKGKPPAGGTKLADVPLGTNVTMKVSADRKLVTSIHAEGQEIHGFIKAVDGNKNTVTVTIGGDKDRTFNVPAAAYLAINDGKQKGKQPPAPPAKLTDVPVGAEVTLRLTLDQKAIVSLSVHEATVYGVVKAVDAGKNSLTLTIHVKKGESPEEKSFDVAKDVAVWIDGNEGKLADLPVDSLVNVKLHADRKTAGSIQAEGPGVFGVVKAVDLQQKTITLAAGKGIDDRTLSASKDIRVFIDDRAGKLGDVVVDGLANCKLTADQKAIVSLHVSGPSIHGTLKEVDADKGKITVTVVVNKVDSADRVFDLAKNVVVTRGKEKGGTSVKAADLKAGKELVLQLSSDQKSVVRISVAGE
jgi:RNA polymerase sigma factor (sigma-70 family)